MDDISAQNAQNSAIDTTQVPAPQVQPSFQKEGMPIYTIASAESAPAPELAPSLETEKVTSIAPDSPVDEPPKPETVQSIVATPNEVPNVVDMTSEPVTLKNVAENADNFTLELDEEEGDFIKHVEEHLNQD